MVESCSVAGKQAVPVTIGLKLAVTARHFHVPEMMDGWRAHEGIARR